MHHCISSNACTWIQHDQSATNQGNSGLRILDGGARLMHSHMGAALTHRSVQGARQNAPGTDCVDVFNTSICS